jgi:uncharacterized damage-inducible protein DinB
MQEQDMSEILADLYRHNLWANERLLGALAELDDDALGAEAPGTYGRVRDTIVHLLAAEGRYVSQFTGERPANALREDQPFPGIDALRGHARRSGEALVEIAIHAKASDILRGVYGGRPYEMPVAIPLIQGVNHATEHRAHIVSILSQRGLSVPGIDGWAYWETTAGR